MFVAYSFVFGYNMIKKSQVISLVGYEANQNRINRGYRAYKTILIEVTEPIKPY